MTELKLLYAEFEDGQRPFCWLSSRDRDLDILRLIHETFAMFNKGGSSVTGNAFGTAIREGHGLLLRTEVGVERIDSVPQGLVIGLAQVREPVGWGRQIAERAAVELRGTGIELDPERLGSALEASWAELTGQTRAAEAVARGRVAMADAVRRFRQQPHRRPT